MDDDAEGRDRRGVYLPAELWDWLDATAEHDGSSRSDLLEGLVLLARDRGEARGQLGSALAEERPEGLWCFGCARRFVAAGEATSGPLDAVRWREGLCGRDDCPIEALTR